MLSDTKKFVIIVFLMGLIFIAVESLSERGREVSAFVAVERGREAEEGR